MLIRVLKMCSRQLFARLLGVAAFAAILETAGADIFGQPGASSPVPPNTAQYLLALEAQDIYLHYCGPRQLFSLRFSPNFKKYLEDVASTASATQMPVVYGVSDLSPQGAFDWSAYSVPRWTAASGADSTHVFYGREVRNAKGAMYGNSIHLVLGPEADPEGWTVDEMDENRKFSQAILNGMTVGVADQYRQFREGIAPSLGEDFVNQFGAGVTTKAHRFALQMYSADSQSEAHEPGSFYFEMFPGGLPPTPTVVFLEAEDGCKGTPTPKTKEMPTLQQVEYQSGLSHLSALHASRPIGLVLFAGCGGFLFVAFRSLARRIRTRSEQQAAERLAELVPCE